MNEMDRLINKLTDMMPVLAKYSKSHIIAIADFIIKDRARIVEPLLRGFDINTKDASIENLEKSLNMIMERFNEVLKLAGVEEVK